MSWYAGAEKASPLLIGTLLLVGFWGGWEASGQFGGKVPIADVQKDYVLRSEAARALEDRDKYAKQIEKLQDKVEKFEVILSELKGEKKVAPELLVVPAPIASIQVDAKGAEVKPAPPEIPLHPSAPKPAKDKSPVIRAATVFDPPSNVRLSPNGKVICWINESSEIRIHGLVPGFDGLWYFTDACDEQMGVIHRSQIRFK